MYDKIDESIDYIHCALIQTDELRNDNPFVKEIKSLLTTSLGTITELNKYINEQINDLTEIKKNLIDSYIETDDNVQKKHICDVISSISSRLQAFCDIKNKFKLPKNYFEIEG